MRIVVTNVFGSQNRGDAALVEVLVASISEAFPGAILEGIASQPTQQRVAMSEMRWHEAPGRAEKGRLQRLFNAWYFLNCIVAIALRIPAEWLLTLPRSQREALAAIQQADLAVSCAGGFLLDVNVSILMNLLQMLAAVRHGIPLVLAPQSIGPVKSPVIRWWMRSILKRAKQIYVREDYSYRFLIDDLALPDTLITRFPDLALFHHESNKGHAAEILTSLGIDPTKPFVAVSVLDWEFPKAPDRHAAQARYEGEVSNTLNLLQEQLSLPVYFVNQVATDLPVARRVAATLKGPCVVDETDRTPGDLRGILSFAKGMIASRFHSCIFALLEGIPVEAISYTYKTDGIMEQLGLKAHVWSIDTFDGTELAKIVADRIQHATTTNMLLPDSSLSFVSELEKYSPTP